MSARDANVRAFKRACATLRRLADAGFYLYLAEDTLNLMSGPSHDDGPGRLPKPRQDRVICAERLPGAGGGDW